MLAFVAAGLAAAFLAWQQRLSSFDTRVEIADLADHLTRRFRMLLASRPELRVLELDSSTHPSLQGSSIAEKSGALGAEYILSAKLKRREQNLRLSMQLLAGDGRLIWSERFEGPMLYQEQLQGWVLDELWPQLPLEAGALGDARELLASCGYPADTVAILTLARVGRRGGDSAALAMVAAAHDDAGLLHLAKARFYFEQAEALPPTQRPVIQNLAIQSLELVARTCPDYPEIELLRLTNTRELRRENGADNIARYPNAAALYVALAELHHEADEGRKVKALANEASLLDPLGETTQCRIRELLESSSSDFSACP
jgi:TolB-like protein